MLMYSAALLEKSSILGQYQIIYQVTYNYTLCKLLLTQAFPGTKSLHKQVGFHFSLKGSGSHLQSENVIKN